ncbi:MAG TPA: PKD domain-containing protein [Vicinamibacterales bacterium]|nr:PKD domain-containing protein [Vicinamibacterales bacterium]
MVTRRLIILAAVLGIGGCTLDKQNAPSLSGPSELALSLAITATPDVLSQDGQSTASIDVIARDGNSQPVRGLTLRVDTAVGGAIVDFGTLSSHTASTNSDGRAHLTYQSPAPPPLTAPDRTVVTFVITPVGTNYQNSPITGNTASLQLVRPGVILGPPAGLTAAFVFSPSAPKEGDAVQFDASSSTGTIVSYSWSFGDGSTGTGARTSHTYSLTGQYTVVLTITDDRGNTASSDPKNGAIAVGANTDPVPAFSISPTTPIAGTVVNFNAVASKAANGHNVVDWDWDFGDGTQGSGAQTTHIYAQPGGYNVTLEVRDDTGRTGVLTKTVTVATSNPTASFTNTPSSPHTIDIINFDASGSSAIAGRVIASYAWEFTYGGATATASGQTASVGPLGGSGGTLTVKLTVTDSAGQIGILTRTVTILP